MSDALECQETVLKSLHTAADNLVPGVDQRRHGDRNSYLRALQRRVRECSRLVDAMLDALKSAAPITDPDPIKGDDLVRPEELKF